MAGIVGLPRSWGRAKPRPGTPIDWGNPLSRGLIHAYLFNEGGGGTYRDSCGRQDLGPVGSPTRGFGARGPAVTLPSGDNYLVQPAWNPGLTLTAATWVVLGRFTTLPAYGGIFLSRASSPPFGMTVASDGVHLGFSWRDDFWSSQVWTGGPAIPTNADCFLAVSVDLAVALAVVDSAQASYASGKSAQPYNGASMIGDDTAAAGRAVNGRYDLALMWGRALSVGELATVRADPHALWAPPDRRWPAQPGVTAVGATAQPAPASATWTASAPVAHGDFVPTDLAGLGFWFKADALGLADGDPIGTLADSSGSGHAITESGTNRATYRTNVVNGLPVARFDGVANWYRSGDLLGGSGAYTISLVMEITSLTPTYSGVVNYNASGDHGGYLIRNDGKSADYVYRAGSASANSYDGTGAATFDTTHFRVVTLLFASDTRLATYVDGVLDGSVTPTGGNDLDGSFGFGNQVGAVGRYLNGDIAEIVVYNSALSDADRGSVESYLEAKYQLSTPAVTIASPAAAAATWAAQAPAVSGGATRAPTTVVATWAAQVPAASGGAVKAPSTVISAWSAPAPAASAGSTTTVPASIATWTAQAPAVSIACTTAPVSVVATWTPQTPAASVTIVATPAVVTATWSASSPAVVATASATVAPAVVIATWTANAPAVTAGGSATVTPTVVTATWAAQTAAVTAGASTSQTVAVATWAPRAATVTAGAGVAPTGGSATWAAPVPSASAGASASPAAPSATWTAPGPAIATGAVLAPAAVAVTWSAQAPAVSVGGSTTVAPAVVAVAWAAPAPAVAAGASATPLVVTAAWTAPAPGVGTGNSTDVTPLVVTAAWSAPGIALTAGVTTSQDPVVATWTAPVATVTAEGSTSVLATAAAAAWSAPAPVLAIGLVVAPGPGLATWTALVPAVATTGSGAVTVLAAGATWHVVPVTIVVPAPYRDRALLRLIADRLRATGEFDEVSTAGPPESVGRAAADARLACLELATWRVTDLYSDPDATPQVRTVHYHLHILVRSGDADVRDGEVARLAAVAGNALNGAPLGDASFAGKARLTRGQWLPASAPERRMHISGQFAYLIPDLGLQATT